VRATWRIWLPFVAAALCLAGTRWAGAVVTWVLLLVAMGLLVDGATLLFARSGTLTQHRQ